MSNQVPGTILTNPNQTQDIGSYYVSVLSIRDLAFTQAVPQMRARGLLLDLPTADEAYAIPVGPISIGTTQIYNDGQRPNSNKPQLTALTGRAYKRGVTPLRLYEADRTAARIPIVTPNIMARGRSERLMEDEQYTAALEGRLTDPTGAAITQLSYDGKAYFALDHYVDPVGQTGAQPNLIQKCALTVDNLGRAKTLSRTWQAENKQPMFAGFVPEYLLEVPPALEKVAEKICTRGHVAEGGAAVENIEIGTRYFVNSFLTSSTTWYLHVTNTGYPTAYRVEKRPMQRWDKGPDSALYQDTKAIEIYADEWTDYRLFAWPLCIKCTA